ncbi:MAG: MBL fold metallo-hydrolase, partial [Candidatus Thermoplasmatota archaeon]|nr:MBL fold metallo-hydrolase [Candidatus Thermoplasmatota archaeon]
MGKEKDIIKFLGTAGARFVVAKQLRSSAGVFIRMKNQNIILDPGPGTIVRCASAKPKIDLSAVSAIILTHSHLDHSNDVNILIDAVTEGGLKKRCALFAPKECLEGGDKVVLNYLRNSLEKIVVLEGRKDYSFGELKFSTSVRHLHPVETYGIKFNLDRKIISFMVDTKYFPELIEDYKNSDVLIINVVRAIPHKDENVMHLNIENVKEILTKMKPEKAILTHFGMTMLRAKPWEIAKKLS